MDLKQFILLHNWLDNSYVSCYNYKLNFYLTSLHKLVFARKEHNTYVNIIKFVWKKFGLFLVNKVAN